MFWEQFVTLCNQKNISPNAVCAELGYSNAISTKWRKGAMPRSTTLHKIADYFGVSVDYLLGNENAPQKATILIPKSNEALTEHEQVVIKAYRDQPAMQPAVDKLLGVEQDGEVTVYAAAHSVDKRPDGIVNKPKDQWNKIKGTPDTDESLI